MEIGNRYLIGIQGDNVVFIRPPQRMEAITKAEALLLAAWLVVLAEDDDGEFNKILQEVKNT